MHNQVTKFILYTASSGEVRVDVYFEDDRLWLTQKDMSELFDVLNQP